MCNMEEILNSKFSGNSLKIIKSQIEKFNLYKNLEVSMNHYNIGDEVLLPKGTLLHGTYKNIDGLRKIVKDGLVASDFIEGRLSKYPACVGVWNLRKKWLLKDYINFYSGGTVSIYNYDASKKVTKVIPYNQMNSVIDDFSSNQDCFRWFMEQTKEARFMPSLVQDVVQIGVIFNYNKYIKDILKGDILFKNNVSDKDVKEFVNPKYYDRFIVDRQNPDSFFTDRESAILYGIPSNFIEGILVGRKYERDDDVLREIKKLLPWAYVCNLDGIVIG